MQKSARATRAPCFFAPVQPRFTNSSAGTKCSVIAGKRVDECLDAPFARPSTGPASARPLRSSSSVRDSRDCRRRSARRRARGHREATRGPSARRESGGRIPGLREAHRVDEARDPRIGERRGVDRRRQAAGERAPPHCVGKAVLRFIGRRRIPALRTQIDGFAKALDTDCDDVGIANACALQASAASTAGCAHRQRDTP